MWNMHMIYCYSSGKQLNQLPIKVKAIRLIAVFYFLDMLVDSNSKFYYGMIFSKISIPNRCFWTLAVWILEGEILQGPGKVFSPRSRCTSVPTVPTTLVLQPVWHDTCAPIQERSHLPVHIVPIVPFKK